MVINFPKVDDDPLLRILLEMYKDMICVNTTGVNYVFRAILEAIFLATVVRPGAISAFPAMISKFMGKYVLK